MRFCTGCGREQASGPEQVITNSVGMVLKLIPAGEFLMGDNIHAEPVHNVMITRPFYLGIYPVTQFEWMEVMGQNPSEFKGDDNPVDSVSWEDCQLFIRRLNEREQIQHYRLPSEAEWEYACRAGIQNHQQSAHRPKAHSHHHHHSGSHPHDGGYGFPGGKSALGEHAWYDENSDGTTHPVGEKKPNAWGLYDMHGNVWEWCSDWFDKAELLGQDYYEMCAELGTVGDPFGPEKGSERVLRGGSWFDEADSCLAGFRHGWDPRKRRSDAGFGLRLARMLP